jgi:hypothetical protein
VDWHALTQKHEHLIDENLMSENSKQNCYNHVPNQKVLKKRHKSWKLGQKTIGLYRILRRFVNGTVTVELKPGISERINICRVIPYNR